MSKVTHIIKSPSFESDGRLQKWIKSLKLHGIKSNVLFLEDENKEGKKTFNEAEVSTISLHFRKFFKQRNGYFFKIPEYSFKTWRFLRRCDSEVLIFHDVQQYLNVLLCIIFSFSKSKKIVWDLHELPHSILFKFFFTRRILKYMLEHVDIVVYTNVERRKYIFDKLKMEEKNYFILNNFPNEDYLIQLKASYPNELRGLRNGFSYILWLGGALKDRNFSAFFEAYKKVSDSFNLVILGKVEDAYKEEINNFITNKVVYNNFVKQEEMINYIDNAFFSVVLYNSNTPNNYYCEPNRLYQLLTRGVPSIVGNNPTMKTVVEKYNGGIVLSDDGTSIELMDNAFNAILKPDKRALISESLNTGSIKFDLNWDSQIENLMKELKSFLK